MRRLVALIRWVDFALGLIALDLGARISWRFRVGRGNERDRGLNANLICWRGSVISEGEEFGFASERRLESPPKG